MKTKIVNLALLLVSIFGTLAILSAFPDQVPVHFNIHGVADRFGSKYEFLIIPLIMLIMDGLWLVCDFGYRRQIRSTQDEKKIAEGKTNLKVISITFTLISILFLVLNAVFLYMSYTQLDGADAPKLDVMSITTVAMGIVFILLGNIMPKAKNNSLIGFRFPWTRYNDVTWVKCNRFAGWTMVISGVITAVGGLIFNGMNAMLLMMFAIFGSLIVMLIYAYLVYSDEKKKEG